MNEPQPQPVADGPVQMLERTATTFVIAFLAVILPAIGAHQPWVGALGVGLYAGIAAVASTLLLLWSKIHVANPVLDFSWRLAFTGLQTLLALFVAAHVQSLFTMDWSNIWRTVLLAMAGSVAKNISGLNHQRPAGVSPLLARRAA